VWTFSISKHPRHLTPDTNRNAVNSLAMHEPTTPPMGRLDAIDVGEKKLTIQTEFFVRPTWRAETKVYLGGALKKVYTADYDVTQEPDLQRLINEFHQSRLDEIAAGLRARKAQ